MSTTRDLSDIGIIGPGRMGSQAAKAMAQKGYRVLCYDNDDLAKVRAIEDLQSHYSNIKILDSARDVTMLSDVTLIYVPIDKINSCIKSIGEHAKKGSTVVSCGSVMTVGKESLEKTPSGIYGKFVHQLHGPETNPKGQTAAFVDYKTTEEVSDALKRVNDLYESIGYNMYRFESPELHDEQMAQFQVDTHIAGISYALAKKEAGFMEGFKGEYKDNIERVKMVNSLRIIFGNPAVYAGIAFNNPYSRHVAEKVQRSANTFESLLTEDTDKLEDTVYRVRDFQC